MQISASPGHPGHDEWLRLRSSNVRVNVFLNGEEIKGAIAADDIAGTIVRVVRNRNGAIVIDESGEEVATEVLRGRVRIEVPNVYEHLPAIRPV